jgi:hypothetical protein
MSDLSNVSLKDLCEATNKSPIVDRKSYTPEFRTGGREENLASSRPAVNSAGHFDDFQGDAMWLISELRIWKELAAQESEKRRQVEKEVDQLKTNILEVQMDNRKLERHLHEWKVVAGQARSRAAKYCEGVSDCWKLLEELKSAMEMEEQSFSIRHT